MWFIDVVQVVMCFALLGRLSESRGHCRPGLYRRRYVRLVNRYRTFPAYNKLTSFRSHAHQCYRGVEFRLWRSTSERRDSPLISRSLRRPPCCCGCTHEIKCALFRTEWLNCCRLQEPHRFRDAP